VDALVPALRRRLFGIKITVDDYGIHRSAIIYRRENCDIHRKALICEGVLIRAPHRKVRIGAYSQVGPYTVIFDGADVSIGDNVMIAPHCTIAPGSHNFKQLELPMRHARDLQATPIIIEDGCWIGANCCILDGVTIGHDSVVGAGSVVTRSLPPYAIAHGVPARIVASRLQSTPTA
jgi:acetyltransferase-like isoleucine patch superfamily enzyme